MINILLNFKNSLPCSKASEIAFSELCHFLGTMPPDTSCSSSELNQQADSLAQGRIQPTNLTVSPRKLGHTVTQILIVILIGKIVVSPVRKSDRVPSNAGHPLDPPLRAPSRENYNVDSVKSHHTHGRL